MLKRLISRTCLAAGLVLVAGQDAFGQTPGKVADDEPSYLAWVVFAGAAVIICLTGFMNCKRSHLN